MSNTPDRRRLLTLLGGSTLSLSLGGSVWAQSGAGIGGTGIDSGLGGTGIDAGLGGTGIDGGLGGTGIFGLIEGFSSIWVNDARIEIPETAVITLNGRPAREADLTLGQTVAVEAEDDGQGGFVARRIDAAFALVGPISGAESAGDRLRLRVLGQVVEVSALTLTDSLRLADWVVVTGLRDHRGTIQAANVARTDSREAVVTGPVSRDGRVAGVQVVRRAGTAADPSLSVVPGTWATVLGPLTDEPEPRLVATTVATRPLEVFDRRRFSTLVLGGLPGDEDDTLYVDGVRFSLPGARGRADPGQRGLRDRIHGRFGASEAGLRPIGPVGIAREPLAPFAGPGRKGPGKDRPYRGSGTGQGASRREERLRDMLRSGARAKPPKKP